MSRKDEMTPNHKVIMFMNEKELKEAETTDIKVSPNIHKKDYSYPHIQWKEYGHVEWRSNYHKAFSELKYINLIKQSHYWSDIREESLPKWYENPANIGKLIICWDYANETKYVTTFIDYHKGSTHPFKGLGTSKYAYARLATIDDIHLMKIK